MSRTRLVVLDLDGTVWRGDCILPGAKGAIARIKEAGIHVCYATNNATASPQSVAAELARLGIPCNTESVVTSGMAASVLCRERGYKSAFVVGEEALRTLFHDLQDGPIDCVVVGLCRQFDYRLLDQAAAHVRSGAALFATNRDATIPLEGGREAPGAGSIVAAIETAAGVEAITAGKPEPKMLELVLRTHAVAPSETVVVGDRSTTDIAFGRKAGCRTYKVLTGADLSLEPGETGGDDLMSFADWVLSAGIID